MYLECKGIDLTTVEKSHEDLKFKTSPLYFGGFKREKFVGYEQELGEEEDYIANLIFAGGIRWAPTKLHLRKRTT